MLLKADKDSESGALPDEKLLIEMGKYNDALIKAGVLLSGESLHPSSKGARVRFAAGRPTVIDGPFDSKDLIAGFRAEVSRLLAGLSPTPASAPRDQDPGLPGVIATRPASPVYPRRRGLVSSAPA